jgi:hypothetical protein
MKFYSIQFIILLSIFLACNNQDSTSPYSGQIQILQVKKLDPNFVEIQIQNCYSSRKYVVLDIYATSGHETCGMTRLKFNDRCGLNPNEICAAEGELHGVTNHQQYDWLLIDKIIQDHPFR